MPIPPSAETEQSNPQSYASEFCHRLTKAQVGSVLAVLEGTPAPREEHVRPKELPRSLQDMGDLVVRRFRGAPFMSESCTLERRQENRRRYIMAQDALQTIRALERSRRERGLGSLEDLHTEDQAALLELIYWRTCLQEDWPPLPKTTTPLYPHVRRLNDFVLEDFYKILTSERVASGEIAGIGDGVVVIRLDDGVLQEFSPRDAKVMPECAWRRVLIDVSFREDWRQELLARNFEDNKEASQVLQKAAWISGRLRGGAQNGRSR